MYFVVPNHIADGGRYGHNLQRGRYAAVHGGNKLL